MNFLLIFLIKHRTRDAKAALSDGGDTFHDCGPAKPKLPSLTGSQGLPRIGVHDLSLCVGCDPPSRTIPSVLLRIVRSRNPTG